MPSSTDDHEEDPFNEKTMVSGRNAFEASPPEDDEDPLDEATIAMPKGSSPFKPISRDPSKKTAPPIQDPGEPEESSETFRPFGDATLFEIQRMGRKRPKIPTRALAIAVLILAVGVSAYWGWNEFAGSQSSRKFVTHTVIRPLDWYSHDPSAYQNTLTQMAALPRSEQDSPENRALLAESLILNGILAGDTNQILSGMGIATSLSVIFPDSPVSFYGTSAYAIAQNDLKAMEEIYDRWPESHRDDPEFELLAFVHFARSNRIELSLERAQKLLEAQPDFVRAQIYALLIGLQNPEASQRIWGSSTLEALKDSYRNHRDLVASQLPQLPRVYQDINRLLGEEAGARPTPSKTPSASVPAAPAPMPEAIASDAEEPLDNDNPSADLIVSTNPKAPPPNPVELRSAAPRQSRSGLPMASAELLAKAQGNKDSEEEASALYRRGNQAFERGNLDEALRLYRDALKSNAEFADVYKQIGRIYMQRNEGGRALRSLKIFLQLAPNSPDKAEVEKWIASLE
jgi:tetratricopeptide (TPR) repeat protein